MNNSFITRETVAEFNGTTLTPATTEILSIITGVIVMLKLLHSLHAKLRSSSCALTRQLRIKFRRGSEESSEDDEDGVEKIQ